MCECLCPLRAVRKCRRICFVVCRRGIYSARLPFLRCLGGGCPRSGLFCVFAGALSSQIGRGRLQFIRGGQRGFSVVVAFGRVSTIRRGFRFCGRIYSMLGISVGRRGRSSVFFYNLSGNQETVVRRLQGQLRDYKVGYSFGVISSGRGLPCRIVMSGVIRAGYVLRVLVSASRSKSSLETTRTVTCGGGLLAGGTFVGTGRCFGSGRFSCFSALRSVSISFVGRTLSGSRYISSVVISPGEFLSFLGRGDV